MSNQDVAQRAHTTCAILGAKGFVGSAIVKEAAARGCHVTPIDLDEYDAVRGKSFDLLINANGNSRKFLATDDPAKEFDLSVRSVMRSLHDFKVRHYIHLSTIDVYPDHENPAQNTENAVIDESAITPYGLHKFMAEKLVRYYAPKWTILRMGGFVGPGLWKNSIFDLLNGKPLRVHPDSAYQYLNTADLARIVFDLAAPASEGQIYNAAGDGLITLREVAGMIPGCDAAASQALPVERYEVNVERLKKLTSVPKTRDTVRQFIEQTLRAGVKPT